MPITGVGWSGHLNSRRKPKSGHSFACRILWFFLGIAAAGLAVRGRQSTARPRKKTFGRKSAAPRRRRRRWNPEPWSWRPYRGIRRLLSAMAAGTFTRNGLQASIAKTHRRSSCRRNLAFLTNQEHQRARGNLPGALHTQGSEIHIAQERSRARHRPSSLVTKRGRGCRRSSRNRQNWSSGTLAVRSDTSAAPAPATTIYADGRVHLGRGISRGASSSMVRYPAGRLSISDHLVSAAGRATGPVSSGTPPPFKMQMQGDSSMRHAGPWRFREKGVFPGPPNGADTTLEAVVSD